MRRILKELFWVYPGKIQVILLMALIAGLGLVQPLLHGVLLDAVHSGGQLRDILVVCAVIIGSEVTSYVLGYMKSVRQIQAEASFSAVMKSRVWNHLSSISAQTLAQESAATWSQKVLGDTEVVCGMFQTVFFSAIQFAFFVVGTVAVVFWKNPWMILMFIAVTVVGVAFHKIYEARISHRSEQFRKGLYVFNTAVYDLFLMQPLLRMFGMMRLFSERFEARNLLTARQSAALKLASMRYGSVLSLEMALVHGSTLILGILMYYSEVIRFGDIWVYNLLVSQLAGGVNSFLDAFPQLDRGMEAARSIAETLEIEKDRSLSVMCKRCSAAVEIRNLDFKYDNADSYALSNCSIRIGKGEMVGVFGGNGSGKSTLIQLILGNLKPVRGTVAVGTDRVAIVPQRIEVFQGSVLDNVRLFNKSICHRQVDEVLRECGLGNWVDKRNDGVRFRLSQDVVSGGELQRLAIARALVRNPELLVVDEVSNNLDVIEKGRVFDILLSAKGRMTVISVTHDLDEADKYDRVFVLSHGKLNELRKIPGKSIVENIKDAIKEINR